jgi:hypothetical protein
VLIKERNSTNVLNCVYARSAVVKLVVSMHEISDSNPVVMHIFSKTFCTGIYVCMRVYMLPKCHVQVYTSVSLFVVVCTCLCLDTCVLFYFSKYIPVYTNMAIHIHSIYFNMFSILYYILFTTISYHAIVYGGMGVWP